MSDWIKQAAAQPENLRQGTPSWHEQLDQKTKKEMDRLIDVWHAGTDPKLNDARPNAHSLARWILERLTAEKVGIKLPKADRIVVYISSRRPK